MITIVKDRIILLIRALNYTAAQFADEIGVQKSGISHIISGRNNPSLDFVQKILQRFPEVNMEWLITGKGSMIKGETQKITEQENNLFPSQAGNNQALDLFSTQISPAFEVNESQKPAEPITETMHLEDVPIETPTAHKIDNPSTSLKSQESATDKKEKATIEIEPIVAKNKKVEKILFFYSDRTFLEYYPES
jgi:transcriptional regulator with XRE-family HTH domain